MRTLDDLEVGGKVVVVRVDFNVPLDGDLITDDARIRAAIPTLDALLEAGAAKLVLLAHLGRPKGAPDPQFSLKPVADRLAELMEDDVHLLKTPEEEWGDGDRLLMLENVRFFPGETDDDPALAAKYAALGDVFVDDAFGAAHRAHASNHGIAKLLPSAAGLLLQREVETLAGILADPGRPMVAIVGGAKVTDKLGVLERFLELADTVVIGGAMCFPFLAAQGIGVGDSLCEEEGIEPARRVLENAKEGQLLLPTDLVLGREFSAETDVKALDGVEVPAGWMGLDVGPKTAKRYAQAVLGAGSAFWNGPMGAFELEPFAAGTKTVAEAMAAADATTVVGGGDSASAVRAAGPEIAAKMGHISTGGGASLELIEGKKLPGIEVLRAT